MILSFIFIFLFFHFLSFTLAPPKFSTYFVWSVCCIHARAPRGSSFNDVTGPRGWFKSPLGGNPNINPLPPREPLVGYNLRPHSSSSVGHGEAELKPGTGSSERSVKLFKVKFIFENNIGNSTKFPFCCSHFWNSFLTILTFSPFSHAPNINLKKLFFQKCISNFSQPSDLKLSILKKINFHKFPIEFLFLKVLWLLLDCLVWIYINYNFKV